jgi:hypothetical protein
MYMDFDDFVLDVCAVRSGSAEQVPDFEARVLDSPAGSTGAVSFTLPSREWRRRTATLFSGEPPPPGAHLADRLAEVGQALADTLFQRPILACWSASLAMSRERGRALRLCLRLPADGPGAGDLHRLPWEALRPERSGGHLLLSRGGYLVRQLAVRGGGRPVPHPPRLRVLAVTADAPGRGALDFESEISGLHAALAGEREIELEVERDVGLGRLAGLLDDSGYHVLHVMAHGGAPSAARGGCLYLPDGRGGVEPVDGERFAGVVDEAPGLRLVFLNACRTAHVADATPFTAVATALVAQAKVPAVIAMHYPIRDAAALSFAEEVYRRIARGDPVDEAVRRGRKRLDRERHDTEWAVPVLFSSLGAVPLFTGAPPLPRRHVFRVLLLGLLTGVLALWLAVGFLGPPERARGPVGEATATSLVLHDDETLDLDSPAGTIAAEFDGVERGVILTVDLDGGGTGEQLVLAPDVFLFDVAGTTWVVEVLEVDDDARRVRLRTPRPWRRP